METRELVTGSCFVFDDSYLHAATVMPRPHGGDSTPQTAAPVHSMRSLHCRVVLICDVWHPDLTELERKCITTLFSTVDA